MTIHVNPRERTLADVARMALDGSDNYQAAAKRVLEMLTADERTALLEPYAETAFMATLPLLEAQKPLIAGRKRLEKQVEKLARGLPTAGFAEQIDGFGLPSLAAAYGECGDIAVYRTVSALWKRCGLAVIDGERQRKVAGDAALLHCYSPQRRSTFWHWGTNQVRCKGTFFPLYEERKAFKIAEGWKPIRAHCDAMRYVTKRMLRELWKAARAARRSAASPPAVERAIPNEDLPAGT